MFSKFNFPFRKKEKEKKLSEIISINFKKLLSTDLLYGFDCYTGLFKINACDSKEYFIITKIDEMLSLTVSVYYDNKILDNIDISSRILINNNLLSLDFSRIDSKNEKFLGYGFGRLMMEAMFYTLAVFAKNNNLILYKMSGTVSTEADDTPKKSIKLYKSFDGFKFSDYTINVDFSKLNEIDRDISYDFVRAV